MKKISFQKFTGLLLMIAASFVAVTHGNAQNTCAAPTIISSLPFSSGAQTTCGTVNDYAAGFSTVSTNYGGGEDYVYQVTITNAPVTYSIALGGAATYKIASVHSACPPSTSNTVGGIVTGSGTTASGCITFPQNGTYYIIIDTWPAPDCGAFTLDITAGTPVVGTLATNQPSTATVAAGSSNQQVLRVNVPVTGCGALSLTNLNFDIGTTSNASSIANAKVFYTGSSTTFSTTTQFGSTVPLPSASFSVGGTANLSSGANYFWLVYDLNCTANTTDSVDASFVNATVGGTAYTAATPNPTGSRKITALYAPTKTDGNGTSAIPAGTQNATIVYGAINSSAACPASATQVNFFVQAFSAADITSAKCYYTTTSTFSTATQFGATVNAPSPGTLTFTGSQALVAGANYFWLVYNINCNAVVSDTLNGDITSITVGGTAYPVTGTAPVANPISSIIYSTVTNGDWNNPATWACGSVPSGVASNVSITNAITVNNTGNTIGNVTIASSGSLTVTSSGGLTLGPVGGGNKTLTNNGILTVNGGSLNINGNMLIASGSTFNQSSGDINVDGNDGTSAGSVGIGTDLIGIGTSGTNYAAGVLNLTGGTITIVDPHFSGTATSTGGAALGFRSSVNRNLGTSHTLRIGGTTGTNPSTAGFGFYIDTYINSAILQLGNVEVNGGIGSRSLFTNVVSGAGAINVGGNLTINAGCRMVDSTITTLGKTLAGNITNNGILILSQSTVLATLSGSSTTAVAVTTPQSISGTGVFQNASVSPTANIATLSVNNTSAAGVTLNVPLTLSGTLTLTAGKVNTSNTNLLTLGYNATNVGTLSYTASSWVNGPFKRWISAAIGSRAFPVGNADSVQLAIVNYTTAPTTAGSITAQWAAGNPGFPNATPLTEGSLVVNRVAPTGSWFVDAADGLAGGSYTGSFTAKGYSNVIDYTKLVLLKRPSAGGDWTLDGTHVTTAGSNIAAVLSRTGMSGFSQFAVGGEANIALPIKFEYLTGKKAGNTNALNWKVTCTSTSITMVLERSADARTFNQTITSINATQARCGQPFDAVDAAPINGISYYRLKMIDVDGKVSYSPVAAVINGKAGAELVGIYPTVVKDQAYLSVTSSRSTTMQLSISDMSGKLLKTINQSVVSGSSMLPVNTSSLASGVYNITGLLDGVRTQTLRFVKQ